MTGSRSHTGDDAPLLRALKERILSAGRITFAEFMEAALYTPCGGYYDRPGRIAPSGDFFTSPSAHPAFGALVCVQLREMARLLDDPDPLTVLEMGAGDGTLARDIAGYAANLDPGFAVRLRYVATDRAVTKQDARQSTAIAVPQTVRANHMPFGAVAGCVLSNELLDSFPVHRFTIREGAVRELYVTVDGDRFVEEEGPPSTPAIEVRLASITKALPDGYRGEVNLGLDAWAGDVSSALDRGFVLTIDYGHAVEDLYGPERSPGTLRCYYRHTLGSDPFSHVGEQDITAHVDFSAVDAALRGRGLQRIGATTQAEFLDALGLRSMTRRLGALCGTQTALNANRMAMLSLARPEGLGAHKVVAHAKGVEVPPLTGFRSGEPTAWTDDLPVPLLDPEGGHMPLLAGTYPHAAQTNAAAKPQAPA